MGMDPEAKRNARLKQLQDELAQKLALIQGNEAAINQAMADAAAKRQQIEQEFYHEVSGDIKKYGDDAISIFSGLAKIAANVENAQLAKDKQANKQKEENLKSQLDKKQINQKQYNDALGSAPPPINFIEAGIVGAAGLVEIGVIASEQFVPKFESGTDSIMKGPSHSNGGIKMVSNGKVIGEAEGDEAIISKATTRANMPLIQSLLRANGRPVINATRAIENNRYALGGFVNSTASGSAGSQPLVSTNTDMGEMLEHIKGLRQDFKQASDKQVVFVKNDYDTFANRQAVVYQKGL